MQYMIQNFYRYVMIHFTGTPGFSYELDIQETIPILKKYVNDGYIRKSLEKDEWIIEIDFENIKSIFDTVIQKILKLIDINLYEIGEICSAIFLVGSFSDSKYLQT